VFALPAEKNYNPKWLSLRQIHPLISANQRKMEDPLKPDKSDISAGHNTIPAWLIQVAVLALLAATLWVGRYWYSAEFGLYEDDYTRTPQALSMDLPELGQQVWFALSHFTDHGKPLHAVMIYTFSFLGARLGGLAGNYWVGFMLNLFSAWLFYRLLRRLASPAFAITGALVYCLFCADTTQVFLTHALGMTPSLIFLLLAFHCYLSGKKPWSYVLAVLILFNYETPFTVFLAAPLLTFRWERKWLKQAAGHFAILAGCLAAAVVLRLLTGESRVAGLDARTAISVPITHMLFGPFFSLKALLSKPYLVARNLKPEMVTAMLAAFPVFSAVLWAAPTRSQVTHLWRSRRNIRAWLNGLGRDLQPLARLSVIGLALLVLAYPLTFTVDVAVLDGRDSRVHFAAVVGASWLAACAGTLVLQLARAALHKLAGAAALGAYFSLLLAYGFVIQGDYALAWRQQRLFWTQLLPLVGDAADGTVILVEPSAPRATGQIGVITWSTPRVLEQIYAFPPDWARNPRVYRLEPGWEPSLGGAAGRFQIDGQTSFIPESLFLTVESTNVILIQVSEAGLTRRVAPLALDGVIYPLKLPSGTAQFAKGPLFDLMILPAAVNP